MNNNLSEEQYNALVRDAMRWRKHCILVEKAETAIMDHRGHSYWEGYSDGKRDAEQITRHASESAIEVAADYDWRKEYQRAENAAPQAGQPRTVQLIGAAHPEQPAVAAPVADTPLTDANVLSEIPGQMWVDSQGYVRDRVLGDFARHLEIELRMATAALAGRDLEWVKAIHDACSNVSPADPQGKPIDPADIKRCVDAHVRIRLQFLAV